MTDSTFDVEAFKREIVDDHGGGNAGDTASIAEVLQQLQRGGAALDALARVREVLDEVSWDAPSDRQAE
jgi:hypothetical protein